MRKFTLLAALAFCVLGANAQNLDFVRNDQVLEDGAAFELKEPQFQGKYGSMDAHVYVKNSGSDASATLTISVLDGQDIGYCGFMENGSCAMVSVGNPLSRTYTVKGGEVVDPQVHTMAPIKPEDTYKSVVEYKLVSGSLEKKVTVTFNYEGSTSISNVYGSENLYVADNALQYSFDNVANRSLNVYSITGAKVMTEVLENAGTIELNNLNKGVYLYEIMENGKRVAAHKCVIR